MRKTLCFSVTIKDCRVIASTHGGKGGQHANRSCTAIKIIHDPSGAVGQCRDYRSQ